MCVMGLKAGIYGGSGYAGMELVRLLAGHPEGGAMLVIDLSADFRLPDVGVYEEWYGAHTAPGLLEEAHYGLPEVFGAPKGRLVANPGCYPTAALLALAPVVRRVEGCSLAGKA